jgi:hypothetical protein
VRNWDDPALVEFASDPPFRRNYRRLQSWYRQEVLGVPPGRDSKGNQIGNLLPAEAVANDNSLNFLQGPELARIAEDRIGDATGTVDADRLRRNMLSSQPLSVNLFGPLCGVDPKHAAHVLQSVLDCDISSIGTPRIEWNPTPPANYLDDRTAFDVYVEYTRPDGAAGFIAIETKYTDSFSDDRSIRQSSKKRDKYRKAAAALGEYDMDRVDDLFHAKCSQLFRMALLAALWRKAGAFEFGLCIVAALEDDTDAIDAVDRLSAVHNNPSSIVRHYSHEGLVQALGTVTGLESWAEKFRCRYLDLGPVL